MNSKLSVLQFDTVVLFCLFILSQSDEDAVCKTNKKRIHNFFWWRGGIGFQNCTSSWRTPAVKMSQNSSNDIICVFCGRRTSILFETWFFNQKDQLLTTPLFQRRAFRCILMWDETRTIHNRLGQRRSLVYHCLFVSPNIIPQPCLRPRFMSSKLCILQWFRK